MFVTYWFVSFIANACSYIRREYVIRGISSQADQSGHYFISLLFAAIKLFRIGLH